jgi:hypothetical protein
MRYTLTTLTGKCMEFHILACARLFQSFLGGVIEEVHDGGIECS